jgi:hypothetical protein
MADVLELLKWHYFSSSTMSTDELKAIIDFLVGVVLDPSDEEIGRIQEALR